MWLMSRSELSINSDNRLAKLFWILLTLAVIVLSGLVLSHSGVNYREQQNLALAKSNFAGLLHRQLSSDDPMPLYYLLIHGLAKIHFSSLADMRELSLFAVILAGFGGYFVGYRATEDKRVGLLGGLLIGLSPFMVWFGNRAAVYTLLALLTLINLYFYIGLLKRKNWSWPGYIMSSLVALGFHFFFITVLLSETVFYFLNYRRFRKRDLYIMGASLATYIAGLAAWIAVSNHQTGIWQHLPFTSRPSATNIFIIFTQFLFGFQSVLITTIIMSLWPLLVIVGLLAVQKYVKPPPAIRYFALLSFGIVLFMFAYSWIFRPLFLASYLIVCLPPFMLLISWYLIAFDLKSLSFFRYVLLFGMLVLLTLELSNPKKAIQQDYLGAPVSTVAVGNRIQPDGS